jgi:hypothetical protein
MNFRKEIFKYREIQAIVNEIGEGNNKLFSSRFYRGRLYFADSRKL